MYAYVYICMYVYVYVQRYVNIFNQSFLTTIAYYKMLCCYCFDWNSGCLSRPQPIDIFKIVFSCLISCDFNIESWVVVLGRLLCYVLSLE